MGMEKNALLVFDLSLARVQRLYFQPMCDSYTHVYTVTSRFNCFHVDDDDDDALRRCELKLLLVPSKIGAKSTYVLEYKIEQLYLWEM